LRMEGSRIVYQETGDKREFYTNFHIIQYLM